MSSKGKGGNKKRRREGGLLTPMQYKFVDNYAGNATEAAKKAGFRNPNVAAAKLMKNPNVRAAIDVKMKVRIEAEARKEGEEIGKARGLERAEHLEILAEIARNTKEAASDRIRAVMGSAELKLMRIARLADVTAEYEDKSEEEVEFFCVHGYWPKKSLDPGKSGTAGSQS